MTAKAAEAGIVIYPIVVGSNASAVADSQPLADGTGGQLFRALSADEVSQAITAAIGVITTPTGPTVSNDHPTQTVQNSDALAAVHITATAADLTGLVATTSFSKDGGVFQTGLPASLRLRPRERR